MYGVLNSLWLWRWIPEGEGVVKDAVEPFTAGPGLGAFHDHGPVRRVVNHRPGLNLQSLVFKSYFGARTSTSPGIIMLELYSAPGKCTLCHATFNFMLKTMQNKPTKLPPAKTHVQRCHDCIQHSNSSSRRVLISSQNKSRIPTKYSAQ